MKLKKHTHNIHSAELKSQACEIYEYVLMFSHCLLWHVSQGISK